MIREVYGVKVNSWVVIIFAIVFIVGLVAAPMGAAAPPDAEKVDVLIGFHGSPNPGLVRAFGGEIYWEFTVVDVIAARIPLRSAEKLGRQPGVRYVELDRPVYSLEINVASAAEVQTLPWGIDRVFGDENYSFPTWQYPTESKIAVAVLDTGIDRNHEDLAVEGGRRFYLVSSGPPWNRLRDDDKYDDVHGHGTHVAGTIAALDNDRGVVGVAPDVKLYAVKVLGDDGRGTTSTVVAGIEWAMEKNIPVLNMSFGSTTSSQTEEDACMAAYKAGHLLVSSAGNSGNKEGTGDTVGFPAKYDSVIAVAASDQGDERSWWDWANTGSSTGPAVELIAPGSQIKSTEPGDNYGTKNGTSMASPHVAGVAALVWAVDPDLTNVRVRQILRKTAEDLGLEQDHQGHGLVRADLAVRKAAEFEAPDTGGIQGTVMDNGGAVAGATVAVEGTNLWATTGADGAYHLENVPVGDCSVIASADGYYPKTVTVSVVEGATVQQDFTLQSIPIYTVFGTVTNTNSDILVGASVTIEGTVLSAITQDDGKYTISDVEEGTYDITARKDGYVSETKTITVSEDTTVDFQLSAPDEDAVAVIDMFKVTTRTTGPWFRANVVWEVSHSESALFEVKSQLLYKGAVVDTVTTSVSGDKASGEHSLRTRGNADAVRLTVTDINENEISETRELDS